MLDFLRWFVFEASVLDPKTRYWIAFLASAGAFLITSYFAAKVQENARLFTVLALLAGIWALAMALYSTAPYPELAQEANRASGAQGQSSFRLHDIVEDVASFLMVFAGAILARERDEEHWFFNSQLLQVAALSLLAALAIPHQLPSNWKIPPETLELALALVLGLLGFLALGMGGKAVAHRKQFPWLAAILVVYAVLTTARNVQLMLIARSPQSDFLALSFATIKLLLAFALGYVVLWHLKHGKLRRAPANPQVVAKS